MLAHWNRGNAPTLAPVSSTGRPPGPCPRKLVALLADALGVAKPAVQRVLAHADFDVEALKHFSLLELGALPGMTQDAAEKLFYLVQWEHLQAHLELHGSLPESAELEPLLSTLTPIFERHFRDTDRLNAAFLRRYRAHLAGSQRPCRWQRPCLELLPKLPKSRFLTWLGF